MQLVLKLFGWVIVLNEAVVLIVGLDGGTFKKLKPWLVRKELPLLSKLFENGCHGNLRAFFPTLSPLEWACFYTGKSPSKLGLFALSHVEDLRDPNSRRFIDTTSIKSKSLWRILSEHRIPVGVVNIPATYPVEEVEGFMISGYLTPPSARDYYYPKSIEEYLRGYKIESDFEYMPDKTVHSQQLLEELKSIADHRTYTIIEIMHSIKIRLLAVNFKEIDVLQHVFWDDDSTLLDFMKSVDTMVSRLVDELKPTHVFIMSDHGFHEAESEYFYLNTWLKQKSLLKAAGGFAGRFWNNAYKLAIALSKRSGFIRRIVVSRKESATKYAGLQIDLNESIVYASQWGVFFSSKARTRQDYYEMRTGLREELLSLKSPSGYKVFDHVYFREELFEGELLERFPDLIPIPSPRFLINPNLYHRSFDMRVDRPYLKGAHKSDPNGIFIFWGQGVRPGLDLGTLSICDIAPTTLFLFGFDTPSDMDGKLVKDAFSQKFLTDRTKHTIPVTAAEMQEKEQRAYSEEEQEEIMEQLRKLGYV